MPWTDPNAHSGGDDIPWDLPWNGPPRAAADPVEDPAPARGEEPRGRAARLLPAGWRGARLDPGRTGAVVLALVAALAALVAAAGVWLQRPQAEPVAGLPAVVVDQPAATATADPAAAGALAGPLVVSVSGKVARPGLVQVQGGARVADALTAAGGPLPGTDLSGLNLARRVTDGEQIAVGVPPAPDSTGPTGADGTGPGAPGAPGAAAAKVNLNTATVEQLDALPGVGPVTAERIVGWRTANGRFARVEQLREVEGIGEQRFARLRDLVAV